VDGGAGYRPRRPALARTLAEAAALPSCLRRADGVEALLARVPRGDGHAVLMMPSTLRGDSQTESVRNFLGRLGYCTYGWDLGINLGPTKRVVSGMQDRLAALADRHGKISVVGYSLGGLFARWLAVRWPERVRGIVTVCSPFRAPTESLFVPLDPLVDAWPGPQLRPLADETARPFAGLATFIYSPDDGIVAWASCCDPDRPADNIATSGPHVAIAENLDVFRIVAERLARPG
jgi:pimeloyl-ACP methyl ester carboxylesterase